MFVGGTGVGTAVGGTGVIVAVGGTGVRVGEGWAALHAVRSSRSNIKPTIRGENIL